MSVEAKGAVTTAEPCPWVLFNLQKTYLLSFKLVGKELYLTTNHYSSPFFNSSHSNNSLLSIGALRDLYLLQKSVAFLMRSSVSG